MKKFEISLQTVDLEKEPSVENQFIFEIKNVTDTVQNSVICLQTPLYTIPFEYLEIDIVDLEPNQTKQIDLNYQFTYGGRYVFYFWEKDAQLDTLDKTSFFIPGSGFYSGDVHNHSFYSDGKSTLTENRASMLDKGHSFLYSTDHNTLEHGKEIIEFQRTEEAEEFLHMVGWEFTSKHGHALAYGAEELYDPTKITEKHNLEQWQTYVDAMNRDNGIVFLAHPYEAPKYEFSDDVLMQIKDINGIEVWNGLNHHALSYQNRKAFEMWDALNRKGEEQYIGNAVSDAHTKEKQGKPYIKGYLNTLTQDSIHQLLKSGCFIGSNGPEITFEIENAQIGETYYIAEEKKTVKFSFTVFDPAGHIENIILYKNVKDKGQRKAEKVLEIYPVGKSERRFWKEVCYMDVSPNEFYRLEVVTAFGIVAYDAEANIQDKGFAYTNPIWISRVKND
ncbi:CehA/McbA family metallohydrolase [Ornithinibacillus sp. 4-3]|uniref:CehA/McbA family metallohydrolase n=1 Tax=Ornithinibacillus sp. 4-3 TaxID=3231488 RepID=A0AB39HUQ5_9BACI